MSASTRIASVREGAPPRRSSICATRPAARRAQWPERRLRFRRRARARASTSQASRGACGAFPGLAHRMEQVGRIGATCCSSTISKATNADAAEKALLSFRDIFWILGGKAKEGGIEPLRPLFPRVRKAYLIGASSDELSPRRSTAPWFPTSACGTLDMAVAAAARDAARARAASPSCCCRRPARPTTNSPISRRAAIAFRGSCGRSTPGGLRSSMISRSRTRTRRRLVAHRRSLAARRLRRADGHRRRHGARRQPGRGGAARRSTPSTSSTARRRC